MKQWQQPTHHLPSSMSHTCMRWTCFPPLSLPSRALCSPLQAVLRHEMDTSGFTLRVPELSVKAGELVAVVGRVGAGKSSILQAMLGNMQTVSGLAKCQHSASSCLPFLVFLSWPT